jgi:thiamine-monophosphate kinase
VLALPGNTVLPSPAALRSGANPGDSIFVTGSLGGAWRSERHLNFTPRIKEALWLAENYPINAMIDISDSLSSDLHTLCESSGAGANILADAIPISPDAYGDGIDPLKAALEDGEDYELLFTTSPDLTDAITANDQASFKISRIGTVTNRAEITIKLNDNDTRIIECKGWNHST